MLAKVKKLLNEHIALENQAHFTYLHMATWAEIHGYPGASSFFYRQSQEERGHMLKVVKYLTERDEQPEIPTHQSVETTYGGLEELFVKSLAHEVKLTKFVEEMLETCLAEKDFATFFFLGWFVSEQREEELMMHTILQSFKNVAPDGLGLYTLDQSLYSYPKK